MKIGELAKLTDCAVETIRYYERESLLPEPARSDGNYRVYTQAHAERLTFIRNCRANAAAKGRISNSAGSCSGWKSVAEWSQRKSNIPT